jgi:hypothetical protein
MLKTDAGWKITSVKRERPQSVVECRNIFVSTLLALLSN